MPFGLATLNFVSSDRLLAYARLFPLSRLYPQTSSCRIQRYVLELLGLIDIKMDFSRLVATATALDKVIIKVQNRKKECNGLSYRMEFAIIIRWLRVVRTFFLCSTTLANNYNAITRQRSQKKRIKMWFKSQVEVVEKRRMRKGLESLLVRVEDVVRRIMDNSTPFGFRHDMESVAEEMDDLYKRLPDYLRKYSTAPDSNQIMVILHSVLENSKDFDKTGRRDGLHDDWGPHIKNIQFPVNFIRFGTLLCAENQEFQYSITQILPLAIDSAHFTVHMLSNIKGTIYLPNGLTKSMVRPYLHEVYASALASLKHSQESRNPTLDLNDPFVAIMEDFVVSLLSTRKMMRWETVSVVSFMDKLDTVYKGLRFLRIILKNRPEKFDGGKIRGTTVAAICDAGVIIFSSLHRKDFEISHAIQEFSESIQVIRLEVVGYVLNANFPQTNVLGFLDFLLEDYIEEVNGSGVDSDALSSMPSIQEYLIFLKSFVGNLLELRNRRKNAHQDLWSIAMEVAYKIEFFIDQIVLGDTPDSLSMSLQSITEDIMIIKADSNIFDEESKDINNVQETTDEMASIISSEVVDEVVGFESEKETIINRLLGNSRKLQIVAVVGMPGSGKTTLATKVYEDSSITYHFHKMARCSISQVFNRRKVLLELINQTKACEIESTLDENDLSHQVWQSLKGRKYLIFIDDIWDAKTFDILRESLPDDNNQSRILLTSRNGDVVPEALLDDKPLFLRHLTMAESLKLLLRKLFPAQEDWPSELHEFGVEIAEYCKGLPLTLVITTGFLKTKKQEGWRDVLKTLRSSSVFDLTVRTIELSYTYLPDHLKPLFLWFGAYPEDHEISVKEIIWLWISEGLVRKFESTSSEEVARGYINILIARGLVMVAGRRSTGGVKTCRVHDLLRDFCLRKANEEFFLHILKVDADKVKEGLFSDEFEFSSFYELELLSSVELRNMRRLCIYSKPDLLKWEVFCPRLRSLIFFGETQFDQKLDVSVIFRMFKLLRVLNIAGIEFFGFPSEIGALAQLRYLAIKVTDFVGPAIGNLSNLEILILSTGLFTESIDLPDTIWNLQKLKHLCTDKKYDDSPCLEFPIINLDSSCNLVELESLSILCCGSWSITKKQLKKFPNISRLRCLFSPMMETGDDDFGIVDFSFLSQLNSLFYEHSFTFGQNKLVEVVFPENVKKLTLFGCELPWIKMSSVSKLPHLAVLKLLQNSFVGKTWDFEEVEVFPNLKFLKLESLDIIKWTTNSNDQFPKLEKLVLSYCLQLQEIPEYCMENAETLKVIEVIRCPLHVVRQVRKIEKTQKEYGTVLQVHERDSFDDSAEKEENLHRDKRFSHVVNGNPA